MNQPWQCVFRFCRLDRFGGALLFYSRLPWPKNWPVKFTGIAAFAPLVGGILTSLLLIVVIGLIQLKVQQALIVGVWILGSVWLTGGLHLDGVADSADGLAVMDEDRRLAVMQDSQTGAFGAIAVSSVLILKTLALLSLPVTWQSQAWGMLMAMVWGRWGQLLAIACYPYLRQQGKGAMHRQTLRRWPDLMGGTGTAILLTTISGKWLGVPPLLLGGGTLMAILITAAIGKWFAQQFGGMTGDVYGAIVEWSEVGILASVASLLG